VLLGEYAVLSGEPALAMAVDRRVRVTIAPADVWRIDAAEIGVDDLRLDGLAGVMSDCGPEPLDAAAFLDTGGSQMRRLVFVVEAIAAASRAAGHANMTLAPRHVTIESRAFQIQPDIKLGIGSSAAVTVALVGGLLGDAGMDLQAPESRALVLQASLDAHRRAQAGSGSGIDIAMSLKGSYCRFQRQASALPLVRQVPARAWLAPVCIWSGQPASTRQMIAGVSTLLRLRPQVHRHLITAIGSAARLGDSAIERDAPGDFYAAVQQHFELMQQLGAAAGVDIVSEAHLRIQQIVAQAGGVYKPSGAGGGDLGVAWIDRDKRATLLATLVTAGYFVPELRTTAVGLEVLAQR